MAVEACFQVGTIASTTTTRAGVLHAQHPFPHKEKLNLPVNRGSKRAVSPLSSPSSPSSTAFPSIGRNNRRSRFICEAKNAVDEVLVVNDATWNNLVIGSEIPVLVDFWAPWCGPCRMIEPVIVELAKEYAGKLICFKVNTDECPNIATKYGIRSIPTVLLFKNGEKKESIIGAVPKSTLSATIEKYVEA